MKVEAFSPDWLTFTLLKSLTKSFSTVKKKFTFHLVSYFSFNTFMLLFSGLSVGKWLVPGRINILWSLFDLLGFSRQISRERAKIEMTQQSSSEAAWAAINNAEVSSSFGWLMLALMKMEFYLTCRDHEAGKNLREPDIKLHSTNQGGLQIPNV